MKQTKPVEDPPQTYDGYTCPKCGRYMHPVETHVVGICCVCDPEKFDKEVKKHEKRIEGN